MGRTQLNIVLIAALSFALVRPAPAETLDTAGKQIYAGIAVVGAAVAIGIVLIVLHEKHKTKTITGCVATAGTGMNITDEKDKRNYPLSGDPGGLRPGDRMTLEGKRRGNVFEAHSVIKDLGGCQP
jgi:hypothetical protein